MPTPELNLVKPTEYEELMARLKLEHQKFEPAYQAIKKAVKDIIFTYGYIQWEFNIPGRPMTLEEFIILNKNKYPVVYVTTFNSFFVGWTDWFVSRSWNWQDRTIDIAVFTQNFYRIRFEKIFHNEVYLGNTKDNRIYLSQLIPPNLKELLEQVLEYRKQNANTKQEAVE